MGVRDLGDENLKELIQKIGKREETESLWREIKGLLIGVRDIRKQVQANESEIIALREDLEEADVI